MSVVIYTLEHCPNCVKLKEAMKENGITYKEIRMDSAEGQTELKFNGVFAIEAPILQIGDVFLEVA